MSEGHSLGAAAVRPPPPPLVIKPHTTLWSERPAAAPINMIVIHALSEEIWWPEELSGEPSRYVPAVEWLSRAIPGRKPCSAHATIDPGGTIYRLCDDWRMAWHAGESRWQGETNLNRVSLGVELLVAGRHDYASFLAAIARPNCFTSLQYRALGWLVSNWSQKFPIPASRLLGHSQISGDDVRGPGKGKRDPGEGFDWVRLRTEVITWFDVSSRRE